MFLSVSFRRSLLRRILRIIPTSWNILRILAALVEIFQRPVNLRDLSDVPNKALVAVVH
jgi:peptidoglycan/LPS O-acetylase OafA/YrhL